MASGTHSSAAVRARFRLALTAYLHGTVLSKHRFDAGALFGRTLDPHSIVAVAESRIIADGHREPRDPRIREHAEHRRERADEDHDLETEDGIRHPGRDRLAADDERP